MTDTPKFDGRNNADKPGDNWGIADEAMTGARASYLKTLCEKAATSFDLGQTKAETSKRIDALQAQSRRGA